MIEDRDAPLSVDPIAAFVRGERPAACEEAQPVRLDVDVTVRSALASVGISRTYRNERDEAAEVFLTIPVPVRAAFFSLTAVIGDCRLRAHALPSDAARDAYEKAVASGRPTVLHEELLKGVHLQSVAQVMPRTAVHVTVRWVETLRWDGTEGRLRVPLTVGEVYGVSGLLDTDDPTHGGARPPARLRLRHDADIAIRGWKAGSIDGQVIDGREARLTLEPCEARGTELSLAVLVDRSGSMDSPCDGMESGRKLSKHDAVRLGLSEMADRLRPADRVSLWEFDDECSPVGGGGAVGPAHFASLVEQLRAPAAGAEIGEALERVCKETASRDILLITDGKSHALDVQSIARAGHLIFVVLVGEDSLEVKGGHLAALTGATHTSASERVSAPR